jgi:hypothetical protein
MPDHAGAVGGLKLSSLVNSVCLLSNLLRGKNLQKMYQQFSS